MPSWSFETVPVYIGLIDETILALGNSSSVCRPGSPSPSRSWKQFQHMLVLLTKAFSSFKTVPVYVGLVNEALLVLGNSLSVCWSD